MEQVRLYNPKNGADINSNFVHADDEVKKPDQKTKELKVTNAKKVTFPKDSYIKTDRKTADWVLKTWGFITEVSSANVPSKDPVEEPESEDVTPEVVDEPTDVETPENETGEASEDVELTEEEILNSMEEDFAAYKDIGFKNLKGDDRDNYKLLKESLEA